MEPETSAAVMARHHPRPLLAAVGIMRCVRCCRRWPCNHWLLADDRLRRHDDLRAIQRMKDILASDRDRP
jgi:hypothetical protein